MNQQPEFIPINNSNEISNSQQEIPIQNQDIYSSVMQEERVNNFLSQTSPSKTLEDIDYKLRGFLYSREEKKWIKVTEGVPDKIRIDFMQMLTTHLSEDVRMTNLDYMQINGIMEFIIEWVVDYLDDIADDYNMPDTQLTKLGLIVLSAVFFTILRSQGGVERGEIFDSLRLHENLNQIPSQKQGSDWWKIWK